MLELLDLPRESSVGLVIGATMAGFVALAAARSAVIGRFEYDFERDGLQCAPFVLIYLCDDTHVSNLAALRHLGFGKANIVHLSSDANGLMDANLLQVALAENEGPKIIIATAGHIRSGGFEDFERLAQLAQLHNAWLHVDRLWSLGARPARKEHLTVGLELADSWSVDGHKWLQIPNDSGFAIVKDVDAHKRAMDITAGYLNQSEDDGRNPTEFNPDLSHRARGFAAWAVIRALGKSGVRDLVASHCRSARWVADEIAAIPGLEVAGVVELNQVIVTVSDDSADPGHATRLLAEELNNTHAVFVRTAIWKGRIVLRLSFIANGTDERHTKNLARSIRAVWTEVRKKLEA